MLQAYQQFKKAVTATSSRKQSYPDLSNPELNTDLQLELNRLFYTLNRPFKDIYEQRKATLAAVKDILSKRILRFDDLAHNPEKYFNLLELLGIAGGGSFATLVGVQHLLGGGSILYLMDKEMQKSILPKVENGEVQICFCMTEMGHGTNVSNLETVAILHEDTKEIEINNVTKKFRDGHLWTKKSQDDLAPGPEGIEANTAVKAFIGNATPQTDYAVVFARFVIEERGELVSAKEPHVFLVPLKENAHLIRFTDMGPKYGLNGLQNSLVEFNGVKIPMKNFMMGNLATLSAEGEYSKTEGNILLRLMCNIKFGRLYITCTSSTLMSVFCYIGLHSAPIVGQIEDFDTDPLDEFKNLSINTRIYPPKFEICRWASIAMGLGLAKKALIKDLHHYPESIVSGMKVLSTTFVHESYFVLKNFVTSDTKQQLDDVFKDWVASCTYEGDNVAILPIVIGEKLLKIKSVSELLDLIISGKIFNSEKRAKAFHLMQDVPVLFEAVDGLKSLLWAPFSDPLIERMRLRVWVDILLLSFRLSLVMDRTIDSALQAKIKQTVWDENQLLINNLSMLFTCLFVLKEFQANNISEKTNKLYLFFKYEVFLKYYREVTLLDSKLHQPLVIDSKVFHSWAEDVLMKLSQFKDLTGEEMREVMEQQKLLAKEIEPDFQEITAAFNNNPALMDLIEQKFCLRPSTENRKATAKL